MAELLSDPVLGKLHQDALERVEARLTEYKKTEAYAALRSSLIDASAVPITEVEAKPPKARDPEKIAALMSRVERAAHDRAPEQNGTPQAGWATANGDPFVAGEIDLSAEIAVDWVENHGILLPADPRIFAPEALNAVLTGRFERRHARNIMHYLAGHDRLLEVGSGLGFIPLRALTQRGDLRALAYDRRAVLLPCARDAANRAGACDRLELADGSAAPDTLARCLDTFCPDVIRIAQEAQLPPDALQALDLGGVARVLLPFASPGQAERLRRAYGPVLDQAGFAEDPSRADSGTLQYDRVS
jgi:hypothetical protein